MTTSTEMGMPRMYERHGKLAATVEMIATAEVVGKPLTVAAATHESADHLRCALRERGLDVDRLASKVVVGRDVVLGGNQGRRQMPDQPIEVKQGRGPDFAEVAEVLEVRTNQIVGLKQDGRRFIVLYSPYLAEEPDLDDPEQTKVFAAGLERGADDVLVLFGEPEEVPRYWETLWATLQERFGS